MSLNSADDAVVAALLVLCKGAMNAELQAELGEPAVRGALGYPAPLGRIPQGQLPALLVYRIDDLEERLVAVTETSARMQFVYYASATPLDSVALRWPLLRRAWSVLAEAVRKGRHAAVSGGVNVLEAAGVVLIDPKNRKTAYSMAPTAEGEYPHFVGELTVHHRPVSDLGALNDLLSLDASYDLGGLAPSEQPLVESIAQLDIPGGDDDESA